MTLYTVLLLIVLVLVLPLLAIRDIRILRRRLAAGDTGARLHAYRWTILIQWPLAIVFTAGWFLLGGDARSAFLLPAASGWQWVAVGAGALAVVFLILQQRYILARPEQLESLRGSLGDLVDFVPHTDAELRLFNGVSVTAGVCEEVLYRGLLTGALIPLMGPWSALVTVTILFGLGHAYQGPVGVLKTAGIGLALGLLTHFSGSIYPAVVVHALVDLSSGRMSREALREV